MSSLVDTMNRFAAAVQEKPAPRLQYAEGVVRLPSLANLTPQERQWIREAEEAQAEEDAQP